MKPSPDELYSQLYDISGVGWPGEMEYYLSLAAGAKAKGQVVLEIACGTGRTGQIYRPSWAWTYDRCTHTASVVMGST